MTKATTTYPLPAVLKIVGIDEPTVTNWSRHGYILLAHSGRGRARQLTRKAIIHLAVMKAISDLHVPPKQASEWAQAGCEAPAGWFTISHMPEAELRIDCWGIASRVLETLDAAI